MNNRSDKAVFLFFALLTGAYFIFLSRADLILCGPEQFFVSHPLQSYWLSQLFRGELPWLAAGVGNDIPLWADPNLGIFYPGNIVYFILPFNKAWNFCILLHLFWGVIGIYWLCRILKLTPVSALGGAFALLFSMPVLSSLNSNEVLITSSWIPWILGWTWRGLADSTRKTTLASVALGCQWLGGFTSVQLFTALLLLVVCAAVYSRTRSSVVLWRVAFLFASALLLTSIQWVPTLFWLPQTDSGWFSFSNAGRMPLFYPGWIAVALFALGLRKKIVWVALIFIALDFLVLQATPILAICLAFGSAIGAETILVRWPRNPIVRVLPALLAIELLSANWHVPQSIPATQVTKTPAIIGEIEDFKKWNMHWIGTRGALSPVSGLRWGITYGSVPDRGLLFWNLAHARVESIDQAIREKKSLQLLRDARIGYVISDKDFQHPELVRVKQGATKFFVHRVRRPLSPLVRSDSKTAEVQWFETAANQFLVQNKGSALLTIHRNALPGWKCYVLGKQLQIHRNPEGWMQVRAPQRENVLLFNYRTPGSLLGTILTAIGTILILAFLIL